MKNEVQNRFEIRIRIKSSLKLVGHKEKQKQHISFRLKLTLKGSEYMKKNNNNKINSFFLTTYSRVFVVPFFTVLEKVKSTGRVIFNSKYNISLIAKLNTPKQKYTST